MGRLLFYSSFLCLMFFSCSSSKNIVKEGDRVKSISHSKLISHLADSQLVFENLYIKKFDGSIEFDNNKFGFKGAMFIKNDSSIVVSIMPIMGIEMFKAYLSPNKVVVIDRTKKQVMEGSFEYLSRTFGVMVDYIGFQSLLTNSLKGLYCQYNSLECLRNYELETERDKYVLFNMDNKQIAKRDINDVRYAKYIELLVIPSLFRVSNVSMKNLNSGDNYNVTYSSFNNFGDFVFPKNIKIVGNSKGKQVVFTMDINQIEKNSANELGFKVPDKYNTVILK